MKTTLTIAKWEVLRLRSRFGGKSKVVIWPVLILAILLSITIYHQGFTPGKGIYTIGIESGGPIIKDGRFNTVILDPATGRAYLKNKSIDLYVVDNTVLMRGDDRSQYAAGALKKYLQNIELNRIAGEYPVDQAFPLRVVISYLDSPDNKGSSTIVTTGSATEPPEKSAEVRQTPAQSETAAGTGSGLPGDSNRQEGTGASPSNPQTGELNIDGNDQLSAVTPDQDALSIPQSTVRPSRGLTADSIVNDQLDKWQSSGSLPEFKAEFTSENEVIVPSLMTPPMPLAQVIIAFLYVVPMFFISVFFTSSFTEEKVNRKLVILLSSPVTRLQVIFGKMLPYYVYSIVVIIGVTLLLKGNILLAMAIFLPVMLFVFAIYLLVALTYRTFKDQTFFSVLALSVITVYLVVPAMFSGVSNLSFISPLTLAVQMYRGEPFTISQYLIATLPLYLIFFLAVYTGRRVFNEEFLMGFKPLRVKVLEAIYLSLDRRHLNYSILVLSVLIIPIVFAIQLVAIIIVSNLPTMAILWLIMLVSIVIEEIAKSLGIYALIKHQAIGGRKPILVLSALSALGFWGGEKLLLLLAANMTTESDLVAVFLGTGWNNGWLFILPLILHFVSTALVSTIASHGHRRGYLFGLVCGTAVHAIYNFGVLFATGAFR